VLLLIEAAENEGVRFDVPDVGDADAERLDEDIVVSGALDWRSVISALSAAKCGVAT